MHIVGWRESTRLYLRTNPLNVNWRIHKHNTLVEHRFQRVRKARRLDYEASRRQAAAEYRAQLSPETLARLDAIAAKINAGNLLAARIRTSNLMRQQPYRLVNDFEPTPF